MIDIQFMNAQHLDEISRIESDTFGTPWTRGDFERELSNKIAIYITALENNHVIGYAGMWHIVNEGHIVNVAVKEENRQQGVGTLLIKGLIDIAIEKEMMGLTLEVRISNIPGQRLYHKFGFKAEGIRRRYYSDTGEDALIMWKYFNWHDRGRGVL
jgi:ribosomal-protein-alanine N-acetyltransferase